MGCYITVGFVFRTEKLNRKVKMLNDLIDSLPLHDYSVLICTYYKDNQYMEKKVLYRDLMEKDCQLIMNCEYGSILFMCAFLGVKNQMMKITYYKEKTHFGFLMEIFEDPFKKKINYHQLEDSLLDYIKVCYEILSFDYAICDNDGKIEFSPDDIFDEEFQYNLLVLPNKKGLAVKKGDYLIDGETKRGIE